MFGRTKLDEACHMCSAPSKQAGRKTITLKALYDWYRWRTSTDDVSIRRVSTCRDLGTCSPFLRLDHNDRLLLALILDVPYSATLGIYHGIRVNVASPDGRVNRTRNKDLLVFWMP